jgi:DnaK suppressor protein
MNAQTAVTQRPHYEAIMARLLARREELAERDRRVRRDVAHRNDPLVPDFADQAIQKENDEPLQAIGAATQEELAQIDAALARLRAGTYGTCEICGGAIEPTRLAVVPYAGTCIECALDVDE